MNQGTRDYCNPEDAIRMCVIATVRLVAVAVCWGNSEKTCV